MNNSPEGILLVNKPPKLTSHDIVSRVRRKFGVKKVGHAGTLDPMAQGLLLILIGRKATRLSDHLRGKDKDYIIRILFGIGTDTLDSEGKVIEKLDPHDSRLSNLNVDHIKSIIDSFIGTYEQEVPWYSAVKVGGKKLYSIARKNQQVSSQIILPKKPVHIYKAKIMRFQKTSNLYPELILKVRVSTGTYTRSLVRDIGVKLGIPNVQTGLLRTRVGSFHYRNAKKLENIELTDILPIDNENLKI